MKLFLFRLSRLIAFISIPLVCVLLFHIIEDTLTPLSNFFKKNPNGTILDIFEILGEGFYALIFTPFVFVLIIALYNWMIFGQSTYWIKKKFIHTKINKNIILFRLSRVIFVFFSVCSVLFILEIFGFILNLIESVILSLSVYEILSSANNNFYFVFLLLLLSIFISLSYNWMCFGKLSLWIENQNKENIE